MPKERYHYVVSIDRDQVPGWNHQPEDMQNALIRWLNESIPHYRPTVIHVENNNQAAAIVNRP